MRNIVAVMMTLVALSFSASSQAAEPGQGSAVLFLSNVFNSSNPALDALGLEDGPSYNLGYFLKDNFMAYGSVRGIEHDSGTNYGIGMGARFYRQGEGPLKTFFDGAYSYVRVKDVAGKLVRPAGLLVNPLATINNSGKMTSLGAFFGAEYLFNKHASIAVKVGATYNDYDAFLDSSTVDVGASEVMFNLYF